MSKFHVKKGDEVVVIAGSARGRRGVIRTVLTRKQAVILESADAGKKKKEGEEGESEPMEKQNLIKPSLHYMRKTQQNPQGGIVWLEGEIQISNVMLAAKFDARAAKRGAAPAQES